VKIVEENMTGRKTSETPLLPIRTLTKLPRWQGIISVTKWVKFVSDRISFFLLKDYWHVIIVLNVYDQNKDRSDDTKDNFYEELEHQSIP
jgi:hypothetical protein